jgi:hypothetical protein
LIVLDLVLILGPQIRAQPTAEQPSNFVIDQVLI